MYSKNVGLTHVPLVRAILFSSRIWLFIIMLSISWEFAIEDLTIGFLSPGSQADTVAKHWEDVITIMVFTAISFIYPTIVLARYITKRDETEQQLAFLAHHDPLTHLPNRNLLFDRLGYAINLAKRHHDKIGLLFIDLDDFKKINDDYGHHVGDEFLKRFAERLSATLRESDTVARYGGDEFIAIITDLKNDSPLSDLIEKLQKEISTSTLIATHNLRVSASIGVALFPEDGTTPEELITAADKNMYSAKKVSGDNKSSAGKSSHLNGTLQSAKSV